MTRGTVRIRRHIGSVMGGKFWILRMTSLTVISRSRLRVMMNTTSRIGCGRMTGQAVYA